MSLKYQSGQEIMVGDSVLFHGKPAEIELVVEPSSTDPAHEWYIREFGGGVGLREAKLGRTFISADQLPETEDLEFVSRRTNYLTAADVLRRYKDEALPAFAELELTDVNQIGNFGERPLHVAACRGIVNEIAALVEEGAEVNASGEFGNTPLHEAVGQGHVAAIEFLLEHGASLSARNESGETPLDKARSASHEDILKLLQRYIR